MIANVLNTKVEDIIRGYILNTVLVNPDTDLQFGDDLSFRDSGMLDSLDIIGVVSFIQKQFGIHIEDSELVPENLDSVERLAKFIKVKLGQNQ